MLIVVEKLGAFQISLCSICAVCSCLFLFRFSTLLWEQCFSALRSPRSDSEQLTVTQFVLLSENRGVLRWGLFSTQGIFIWRGSDTSTVEWQKYGGTWFEQTGTFFQPQWVGQCPTSHQGILLDRKHHWSFRGCPGLRLLPSSAWKHCQEGSATSPPVPRAFVLRSSLNLDRNLMNAFILALSSQRGGHCLLRSTEPDKSSACAAGAGAGSRGNGVRIGWVLIWYGSKTSSRSSISGRRSGIANKSIRCWHKWWELGAAVRATCERHYENFKLDALSFSSPPVIPSNGISLRMCSAFSGTTGRYCFRQNLTPSWIFASRISALELVQISDYSRS